jgi:hypothetical protein
LILEVTMTIRRMFAVLAAVAALFLLPAAPVAVAPTSRVIAVVRDRTPSFARFYADAIAAIGRVVSNLGPGDTFLMIDLGGKFDPLTHVYERGIPAVADGTLSDPKTVPDFYRKQRLLDAKWTEVEAFKAEIAAQVRKGGPNLVGSTIPAVMEYAENRLVAVQGHKFLLVVSDLETDEPGRRTSLPPARPMLFPGVEVVALFAPWQRAGQTKARTDAWRAWLGAGKAASFVVYDQAQSKTITAVPNSSVPRKLVHPLAPPAVP